MSLRRLDSSVGHSSRIVSPSTLMTVAPSRVAIRTCYRIVSRIESSFSSYEKKTSTDVSSLVRVPFRAGCVEEIRLYSSYNVTSEMLSLFLFSSNERCKN